MRKQWLKVCGFLYYAWIVWSCLFAGYEQIKLQIPARMHLYEEDAVHVLSAADQKIDPEELCLDFAGNVEIAETSGGDFQAVCHLFGVIPLKTIELEVVDRQEVYPGGIPVGIYVETDGIFVIGTGQIETKQGMIASPAKNVIKTGDYIVSFQGKMITRKQELIDKLANFQEKKLILGIRRNQEEMEVCVEPVVMEEGARLGVWVRDDTQGVGTLTFVTEQGEFGALGHGISDEDSELLMEVSKGKLYDCEIMEIAKGQVGTPGKILGKIIYSPSKLYGEVTGNLKGGIYGTANAQLRRCVNKSTMPIALKQEIVEGEAVILSSVSGTLEEYKVKIVKIHKGEKDIKKGMELVVTDERLLELTGGIVQGMSGSPIIQDGKLVGAVTHVLVNDPTRGYGIFIENMLDAESKN